MCPFKNGLLASFLVLLIVPGFSVLAETFAALPTLVGVGWLAAPILGRSLRHPQRPNGIVAQ